METSSLKSSENKDYGSIYRETKVTDRLTIYESLDERWVRRRIWINALGYYVGSFLLQMGMTPISQVQSSLNSEQGLGVISMAVKSGFMVVGSVLAPWAMQKWGCQRTFLFGSVFYITYIPANFYPAWWTLVPIAVLAGLGCTLEATARQVYLARMAHHYTSFGGYDVDRINSRLFVLSTITIKLSSILSNLISSAILDSGDNDDLELSPARLQLCGINYCNEPLTERWSNSSAETDSGEKPATMRVYMMVTYCTVCGLLAVLCFAFMDPLSRMGITSSADRPHLSPWRLVKQLVKEMKDIRYLLFIPLAVALNGGQSFFTADFNKAFITCSLGMTFIGYVSIWGGVSGIVSCLMIGWFNTKKFRCIPVLIATLLQLIVLVALFYWEPSSTSLLFNYWTLSILTIIFSFGMGTRNFITPVLVSVVFKPHLETAFTVYHFWVYLTSTVFFAWSNFLCIEFKIYFLMATLGLSFFMYIGIEILTQNKQNKAASLLNQY